MVVLVEVVVAVVVVVERNASSSEGDGSCGVEEVKWLLFCCRDGLGWNGSSCGGKCLWWLWW